MCVSLSAFTREESDVASLGFGELQREVGRERAGQIGAVVFGASSPRSRTEGGEEDCLAG